MDNLQFITFNINTMSKLDEISFFLYGKPYEDLEPHQQHDVQNTINNPEY